MKHAFASVLKFPVPPYGDPNYWEHSYQTIGPEDVIEWARTSLQDVQKYTYTPIPLSVEHMVALGKVRQPKAKTTTTATTGTNTRITTSWGETLNVYPNPEKNDSVVDEPILILGCGTSKFGEDMVKAKWPGPIIQVDVSSRVCDTMTYRCAPYLPDGSMQIVQDDATVLSSIADHKINAIIDKGLMDAFVCADEDEHIYNCMHAIHRVLTPGGCFVTFSYSRPEFYLSRLLSLSETHNRYLQNKRRRNHLQPPLSPVPWYDVEIRLLDYIYLYRFLKHRKSTIHDDVMGSLHPLRARRTGKKSRK
jgi:ubiquinone/menaquinone biosynthesis C-methylase UbiE